MFSDVTGSIRQARAWLARQPRLTVAGGVTGALFLVWIIYVPVLLSIRRSHAQWLHLKNELIDARQALDPIRRGEIAWVPGRDATSAVLEQLHAVARSQHVQFLQVSPGASHPGDLPGLTVLPVELTVEGTYRSLGEFLGLVPRTPSLNGAFVRQLTIDREERLLPRLRARLSLEIFLTEPESGS